MEPITSTADKLANHDDRYFLIVVLLVLGVCVVYAIRYLVSKFEAQVGKTDDANKRWENASERFAVAFERNTEAFARAEDQARRVEAALNENTKVLAESRTQLKATTDIANRFVQ